MEEKQVAPEEMENLLPDILSAFMAGDVDVRVVVVFEVGPTGCFQEAPSEGDDSQAVDASGLGKSELGTGEVDGSV